MNAMNPDTPTAHQTEQSRFNMIEQQIRPWEVLDAKVLDLLMQIPREEFVPAQYCGLAFADIEVPVGHGETMLAPKMQGRILQALEIKPTDTVLEIGTGTGFLTALMAKQAKHVTSVELHADLSQQAAQSLARLGISNVTLEVGDAANGWQPGKALFDVIVFTGSLPVSPKSVQDQLNVGGRLFAVVGEAPVMEATMIRRVTTTSFRRDVIFETCIPVLQNAPQPERFAF